MKSFVAIYYAFLLPATITLAIPLSNPDASPTPAQQESRTEPLDLLRRVLHIDSIASYFEPKEQKRSPSPTSTNSSALNSPFASSHNMGHGPVLAPYPDQTPTNLTHSHGNATSQTYDCDPSIPAENLTSILRTGRPQDIAGCELVTNKTSAITKTNSTNSTLPSQNQSNPAYLGGGEAAGHTSAPPTDMIPQSDNSTAIEVKVETDGNGTETTTVKEVQKVVDDGTGEDITDTTGSDTADTASSPDTSTTTNSTGDTGTGAGKPATPYALPPGFTGP